MGGIYTIQFYKVIPKQKDYSRIGTSVEISITPATRVCFSQLVFIFPFKFSVEKFYDVFFLFPYEVSPIISRSSSAILLSLVAVPR